MIVTAPAKINLFLHVTGKRPDGYHALESLVAFPDFGDVLTFREAPALSLNVTGPFAADTPADPGNLVVRAAEALAHYMKSKKGARIVLEKHIPIGAGLGGGSANAAAALHALNLLWRLHLPPETLREIALGLGADVPACLVGKPLFMSGIGEKITTLRKFPAFHVLLVNPCVALPTASVFAGGFPRFSPPLAAFPESFADAETLYDFLGLTRNDLTPNALRLVPAIGEILTALESLEGCRLARMSGSGATCFGLFGGAKELVLAAETLKENHPEWWITPASA